MSFRFEHKSQQYWAKEMARETEVYRLVGKNGPAEKVLTLEDKPTLEEVLQALSQNPSQ
jgi:hypothetical protein